MQAKKKKLCNCGVLCYNRNRNGSLEEKMMNTVAIVEDDRLFNEALYQILKKAGYETARAYIYGE